MSSLNLAGNVFAGYKFAWWDLDGVRQTDPSGAALGSFSFTLNHDSVATAHYVDPNLNSDGDGIPDWYEWTYYGNLSQNASSDSDGDGFTFAQELARGQSPVTQDSLITGGISRSRSVTLAAQISEDPILPGIGAITLTAVSSSSAHVSVIVNPANSATTAYFQYGTRLRIPGSPPTMSSGPRRVLHRMDDSSLAGTFRSHPESVLKIKLPLKGASDAVNGEQQTGSAIPNHVPNDPRTAGKIIHRQNCPAYGHSQ